MQDHVKSVFAEVVEIAATIDTRAVDALAGALAKLRDEGGRLFGGSVGNGSHAVNDLRNLCGIEADTPVDNLSELTARTNDEGWDTVFAAWMRVSRACAKDALLIFSVGGGDRERNVSPNLVAAIDEAKERGMKVFGVVGRDTGHTARMGDAVVVIPPVNPSRITPHSEAFQAVVWHCLVSHPILQERSTKWEGMAAAAGGAAT